jgi:hypothetical protein
MVAQYLKVREVSVVSLLTRVWRASLYGRRVCAGHHVDHLASCLL